MKLNYSKPYYKVGAKLRFGGKYMKEMITTGTWRKLNAVGDKIQKENKGTGNE